MKRSEIFRLAQKAVVASFSGLNEDQKIEVMRVLIAEEDLAKFIEKEKEKAE